MAIDLVQAPETLDELLRVHAFHKAATGSTLRPCDDDWKIEASLPLCDQ